MTERPPFETVTHEVDFCVVGGGMPGITAAIAAARRGAKVAILQDRPVFGGNASSEIRVHVCGADVHNHYPNLRETGILEEIRLENLYRNPNRNFSIWDTILYEKVRYEPNITMLLNCSVNAAEMDGARIASVTGWQLTTQTYHQVRAKIFADCSGDAVLAPLTGAQFRVGREGRSEFNESHAPEKPDRQTMGMTILFQARPYETPQPFIPPAWAHRFERCEDIPYGVGGHKYLNMGYWWLELGGEHDSIRDSEMLRDELLKITYGVWDHIKNRCRDKAQAANWALEWMQFLPGKRESRRYVGAHVMTQNDVEAEGKFDDLAAYGGWSMDDHDSAGFWAVGTGRPPTIFHPAPSPYGIAYRSLYSQNVPNLMFAGRCASASHMAMSSMRVMGTGVSMAQAVGTAAAMAVARGIGPQEVGQKHIRELQQALLRDDAYLPWVKQEFSELTKKARLIANSGNPEPLRDGINRPVKAEDHAWPCPIGGQVTYQFERPQLVKETSLILDSALHKNIQMSHHQPDDQLTAPPPELPREFHLDVQSGDQWQTIHRASENRQRLVRLPIEKKIQAVRFTLDATWGGISSRLFAFYVD